MREEMREPAAPPRRMRRSKLFVPGSRPELMAKAARSEADILSLDLEDAVAPAEKAAARDAVATYLQTAPRGRQERAVRVNGLDSGIMIDDLFAVVNGGLDMVTVPKVESPQAIHVCEAVLAHLERKHRLSTPVAIMATLETPAGIRNAAAIAGASPRVAVLQFGLVDLATAMGVRPTGAALAAIRTTVALAAAEAGIVAMDTAFPEIRDTEGFEADALAAKQAGFCGKSCIHPLQVAAVNRIFSPTAAEVQDAVDLLVAFDRGIADGLGAIQFNGKMIDLPIADEARRLVAVGRELGIID